MEERKTQPVRRANIDGVTARRPLVPNEAANKPQSAPAGKDPDKQNIQTLQNAQETAGSKPKKSRNLVVIIAAVIIFLALSAFAVYSAIYQNKDEQDGRMNPAQAGSAGQIIEQTINDIDQLVDQPDASGEGLSDGQLGL